MRVKDNIKLDKIYQATLQLTAEVGLAGLNMANIAQTAGIATGSVYTYYSSKAELINEIYKLTLLKYQEYLYLDIDADLSVYEKIKGLFYNFMQYLQNNHGEWIFQDQYYFSPYAVKNDDAQKTTNAMFLPFTQILQQGQLNSIIKQMPTNYFIYLLHGFGHEVSAAVKMGLETFNDELLNNSFTLYWDAVSHRNFTN